MYNFDIILLSIVLLMTASRCALGVIVCSGESSATGLIAGLSLRAFSLGWDQVPSDSIRICTRDRSWRIWENDCHRAGRP